MNTRSTDRRRSDLAKIHIAKKQLGLDDATYRAMLQMVAGVESAGDLDGEGRRKVLSHLSKAGFKSRAGNAASGYPGRPDFEALAGTGKRAMMGKIEAYLAEAKRPWDYVHGMARRMFKVERVQWCTPGQLHRIVSALEYDAQRHGRYTG
jgi:phage gp16-like protein